MCLFWAFLMPILLTVKRIASPSEAAESCARAAAAERNVPGKKTSDSTGTLREI